MGSVMVTALVNAVISALVAGVFGLVMYYAVQRREEQRDRSVHELRGEVSDLRERRLAGVEQDILDNDARQREDLKAVHRRMDTELMSRAECARMHEQMAATLDRNDKRYAALEAQLREMAGDVSRTAAIVGLIAERLRITLPSGANGAAGGAA